MTPFPGRKIGQSSQELRLAVFFSFFMHAALVAAGLMIALAVTPRIQVPVFYDVKLVGRAEDRGQQPAAAPAQPQPQQPAAPPAKKQAKVKSAKAMPRTVKAAPKTKQGNLPDLSAKKTKQAKKEPEPEPQEERGAQPQAAAPTPTAPSAAAAGAGEGVAVSSSSGGFQFPFYLAIIREKIERNWNPPPGVHGATAKVQFTVLRSGRVGETRLQNASGNFYFDQAAMRAIILSSPFPPMPEGFYKDYEVFSVDLSEKD